MERATSDTLHYANRLVNWILNLEELIRRKISRMIEHLGWHAPYFNGGQSSGTFDRSLIERSYQQPPYRIRILILMKF